MRVLPFLEDLMADYFTHFSCLFDVMTAENAAKAVMICSELAADLDGDEEANLGFEMTPSSENGPGQLWISSDGNGDPDHVISFVLRCAEAFDLRGTWGFCWADTCSRPRLDGFGGGAQIVDLTSRKPGDWVDLSQWVLLRDNDLETSANPGLPGEVAASGKAAASGAPEAAA